MSNMQWDRSGEKGLRTKRVIVKNLILGTFLRLFVYLPCELTSNSSCPASCVFGGVALDLKLCHLKGKKKAKVSVLISWCAVQGRLPKYFLQLFLEMMLPHTKQFKCYHSREGIITSRSFVPPEKETLERDWREERRQNTMWSAVI